VKIHLVALAMVLCGGTCLLGVQSGVGAPGERPSGVQFEPVKEFPGPVQFPSGIAAGDVNNDGFPDLAVIGTNQRPTPGQEVYIAIGNGNGTFQDWYGVLSARGPFTVAMADMNLDGNLDVITSSFIEVVVALGNGKGEFLSTTQSPTNDNFMTNLSVADLNNDGIPDIVGTDTQFIGGANNGILSKIGDGIGRLGKTRITSSGGRLPQDLAVGDLNNDGIPDLVVANFGQLGKTGNLAVLLGNGNGTFQAAAIFPAGDRPQNVALGDFNNDGNLDVAAIVGDHDGSVSILLGTGDGRIGNGRNYQAGANPECIAVGDFNGDGNLDIVVTNDTTEGTVTILLGNGDGTFQPPITERVASGPLKFVVTDINNDGKPDIVTASQGSGLISVLINTTPFPHKT
jgi:hypothetical protein